MKGKNGSQSRLVALVVGLLAAALLVPTALAGGAASIAFGPSSYDYGTVDAGTVVSHTFVLTNTGSGATGALAVTLSASAAFAKTADTCTGASLGPKKSCSVTVQYAPTAEGAKSSATLSAASKKPLAVATVSLSGASTPPKSQSQLDCESYGGTFAAGTGSTIWTCNGWTAVDDNDATDKLFALGDDCFADGGNNFGGSRPVDDPTAPWTTACSDLA
jgi:hypothetical protein